MKAAVMLVKIFELNPKADQSRHGPSFFNPLKTILKHTNWKISYFLACNPERDPEHPKWVQIPWITKLLYVQNT